MARYRKRMTKRRGGEQMNPARMPSVSGKALSNSAIHSQLSSTLNGSKQMKPMTPSTNSQSILPMSQGMTPSQQQMGNPLGPSPTGMLGGYCKPYGEYKSKKRKSKKRKTHRR